MKIIVDREQFIKELKRAVQFIDKTPVIAIFDSIFIDPRSSAEIRIISSNPNIQYRGKCPADVLKDGPACIPAKLLLSTISLMREPQVTIEHKETGEGKDKKFTAMVYCGKKDKYKISCHNPFDYNVREIPNCEYEMTFNGSELKDAIDIAGALCNPEDKRPGMQGVYIAEKDNIATLIGMDGSNLGKITVKPRSIVKWQPCIMFADIAKVIKKVASDEVIGLLHNGQAMVVQTDEFIISGPMIVGIYPDTEPFWKKNIGPKIRIHTMELLDVIKRLNMYSGEYGCINMQVRGNKIIMDAIDNAYEHTGHDEIHLAEDTGADYLITFAISSMLQLLTAFEAEYVFLSHDKESSFHSVFIAPDMQQIESNKTFITMLMKGDIHNEPKKEIKEKLKHEDIDRMRGVSNGL